MAKASKLYWRVVTTEKRDGETYDYDHWTGLRNFDRINRLALKAHARCLASVREMSEEGIVYEVETHMELDHSSICLDNSDGVVDADYLSANYEI